MSGTTDDLPVAAPSYVTPTQLPVPAAQNSLTGENWARNLMVLGGQLASANNARFGKGFLANPGMSGIAVGLGNTVGQISALDNQSAHTQDTLAESESKRMVNAQNEAYFRDYMKYQQSGGGGTGQKTPIVPTNLLTDAPTNTPAATPSEPGTSVAATDTPAFVVAPERRMPMLEKAVTGQGLPPALLNIGMGLIANESSWNVNAVNKDSGAVGPGQILPSTAANPGYGLQPLDAKGLKDPQSNLNFAMKYLYARGKALGLTDDDWQNNPGMVMHALAAYGGAKSPDTAVKYVAGVVGHGLSEQGQTPDSSDPQLLMAQVMRGKAKGVAVAGGKQAPVPVAPAAGSAPAPPEDSVEVRQAVARAALQAQQQQQGQPSIAGGGVTAPPPPDDTPHPEQVAETPPTLAPVQVAGPGAPTEPSPPPAGPTPHPDSIIANRPQTGGVAVAATAGPSTENPPSAPQSATPATGMPPMVQYVQRLTAQSQQLLEQAAEKRYRAQVLSSNPMTKRFNPDEPVQLTQQAAVLEARAKAAQEDAQKVITQYLGEQSRRVELRGEGSVAINPATGEVIQTPSKVEWTAKDGTPMKGWVNTLDSRGRPITGTVGANNEPAGLIAGSGVPAGQSPGDKAYSEGRAKEIAEQRSAIDQNAASAQQQNFTFDNMRQASGGWNQGPLANSLNDARSYIIAAQKLVGMEPSPVMQQQVDNFTEFNKNAGTVVRQVVHDLSSRAAAIEFQNVQSQMVSTGTPEHIVGGLIDQFQAVNDLKLAQQRYARDWDAAGKPPSHMQAQMNQDLQPSTFLLARMGQTADGKARMKELINNLAKTKEGTITLAHIESQYKAAQQAGYIPRVEPN